MRKDKCPTCGKTKCLDHLQVVMSDKVKAMVEKARKTIQESTAHYAMSGECINTPCFYCKPWLNN